MLENVGLGGIPGTYLTTSGVAAVGQDGEGVCSQRNHSAQDHHSVLSDLIDLALNIPSTAGMLRV